MVSEGDDETVLKVKGKRTVVGFVTDAATGQLLGMDVLVAGQLKWLEGYVSRSWRLTDDLQPVVEHLAPGNSPC